jgi:uncharacterized protein YgiM (DUF1202 family)
MLRNKQPIYLMQTDLKWAIYPYTSTNNKTQKIGGSGCGIVSTNMIILEYKLADILPPTLADISVKNGFRTANDGTSWGFFSWVAKQYNIKFLQTKDMNKIREAIKQDALVVCSMGRKSIKERGFFTSAGHYILLFGISDEGKFYVNDPISKYRTNIPVNESVFIDECKQYFIFYRPENIKNGSEEIMMDKSFIAKKVITAKTLNIREKPDSSSKDLGDLLLNTVVITTGSIKNWYRISFNNQDAYIDGGYLKDYIEPILPDYKSQADKYKLDYDNLMKKYTESINSNTLLVNKNKEVNDKILMIKNIVQ